jgi:AraC family transcriptional regulator
MSKLASALYYIEWHLSDSNLRVEDVANAAGVSKYHISRLFAACLGRSAAGYLRARRVSEAAKALCTGTDDILSIAVAVGYGSHEAFTRAFREHFGITPQMCRAQAESVRLPLTEPASPVLDGVAMLPPPRHALSQTRLIAGIGARYGSDAGNAHSGIQGQWRDLAPYFGAIQAAAGDVGYGVNHAFDDEGAFSYLAGMEVKRFSDLPKAFHTLRLEACDCVVFQHQGHVSAIPASMRAIWEVWAPGEGVEPADYSCFEVYGDRFDATVGAGEVDIWVPIMQRRRL